MSSDIEALFQYLKGKGLKTWHIVLLGDIIGEKLKEAPAPPPPPEIRLPELPELPKYEDLMRMARQIGEELAKKMPKPKEISTKILDKKNFPVKKTFDLVNVNLPGRLKEVIIRSPSTDFSILIMSDGYKKMDRSYSELAEISEHSEDIDAYEEAGNGVYVVKLKDIYWIESFIATIYVDNPITFHNLWVSYEIYS